MSDIKQRKFIAHGVTEYEINNGVMQIWAEGCGDEYHTIHELYRHRMALFAVLCNTIESLDWHGVGLTAWKSKRHSDGQIPFNNPDYFVAGLQTPNGQITYHLQIEKWWDKFKVPELDKAPEYDGHNSEDVVERLLSM